MSRTNTINTGVFFGSLFFTAILVAITYGITRWVGVDPGNFRTWVAGLLVIWWFVVVVTLPWDLYFKARGLMADTEHSHQRGMAISDSDLTYVKRWAKLSLIIAISLHIISALGFALLQFYGVMEIGYFAAAASILLMGFRPAGRAYDYLVVRLTTIGHEIHFPRDDVVVIKNQVEKIKDTLELLTNRLDLEDKDSWASGLEVQMVGQISEQQKLREELEELRRLNDEAHRLLAHDAEVAAAKVAGGAQVVNHVRELVRFFKEA